MISVRGIGLVAVFTVCLSGFWSLLFDRSPNRCDMTYMFQPPQYVNVDFNQPFAKPYKLYSYGEGTYAESLLQDEYHGIPVLFVPGNGGSHKQVRSLASVGLVMSYTAAKGQHFNYFAIDYDEELSAFDGDKLEAQTKFLFLSIRRILSLYPPSGNTKLILVGHSLGGIIAKGLLTKSYFKPFLERLTLIVTLAAPHRYPALSFDFRTQNFYLQTNQRFLEQRNNSLKNINIISIGGGNDDKLVREDLIPLDNGYVFDHSILTTRINDVWIGADHLCIVWCRQMTIKLNRLFYDLISTPIFPNDLKLIESPVIRQRIIDFHLTQRIGGTNIPENFLNNNDSQTEQTDWERIIFYNKNVKWTLHNDQRLVRLNNTRIVENRNHLFPLRFRESIVVIFRGPIKDGLFSVCRTSMLDSDTVCEEKGYSLNDHVSLVPSFKSDSDTYKLQIRCSEYINDGYTHFVVQQTPTSVSSFILLDRFTTTIRHHKIEMPSLFRSLFYGDEIIFEKFFSQDNTFYNLTLLNMNHIWQAYSLSILTTTCHRVNADFTGFALLEKSKNELSEYLWPIMPKKYYDFNVTLLINHDDNIVTNLLVHLEPNCGFRFQARYSFTTSIGQIFRHYTTLLILIGISTMMLIIGIMLFNPMLLFALPNREYSEFIKNLPKMTQCQRAMEEKCCVIFMNIFQIMTSGKYFLYFYTQIVVYVTICVSLTDYLPLSHDIIRLRVQSPMLILILTTILFLFTYSIIFVLSALIHYLCNNFSTTINTFIQKISSFGFLFKNTIFTKLNRINWLAIYAGSCAVLFGILFFSYFQGNFYVVHMFFTILMLSRFISLNYWESRIGRTTTTSYIRSIYPAIYSLLLIVALLHIPETIDGLAMILNARHIETLEWIIISLPSMIESLFYVCVYLIMLYFPMKIDVRLENVRFPKKTRLLSIGLIIVGSFLNILIGSYALSFIKFSIFLIFIIILLQRYILYRLVNQRIKTD